jgi:outer membrane protein assembly factor BamB
MGRLWGVLWGAVVILGSARADVSSGTPRTPNGMLWAGTTFQLRACATANNILVAQSGVAQVQVGQVIRWQWRLESESALSVPQGTDAVFRVHVVNDGNGWDNLTFGLARYEVEGQQNWTVDLFENRAGDGQVSGSPSVNGAGSLLPPGGDMLYLVRMRPPSSAIPTDGASARLLATPTGATQAQVLGEFIAGVVRSASVPTRAWSYGSHTNFVPATLYQGRLFWMGTVPDTNETRIFFTSAAVNETQGSTLGNERLVYGRTLRNFRPVGFSVVLGEGWFTGLGNQLIRIDLPRVVANDTSSDPYTVVAFPAGVQPRLDLAPLVANGRLYVAGSDRRLHAISPDGVRVGQSALLPPQYGAFSTNLVQIGRVFYIGTDQGWVVQFDALTGALRTARRVTMQPIHSLAPAFMGRALLVRAGTRELYALQPSQLSVLWRRTLNEDLVSPVVASAQSEVGAVVDKQGRLFVFHTRFGFNIPLYPQPIFGDQQLASASVAIVRRAGRAVGYVYVLGQLAREASNPQALFRIVTLENPLNRLEYGESTLHVGSHYHPQLLITGTQQNSYCLLTAFRAETNGGTVAGIPLR